MEEKMDQGVGAGVDETGQYPPVELGPLEKIEEDADTLAERTPGAQKTDSMVQEEFNPNTE